MRALGLGQCLLWGALYYSYSVVLVPMSTTLRLPQVAVAGAFSTALLVAALVAPWVGRSLDARYARRVTVAGAAASAAGFVLLSALQGAASLYAAWVLIGFGMATLLYEPAFATVARAFAADEDRLRAIATVSVLGGLASTLALPLIALAVGRWGWQTALVLCAVLVVLAALGIDRRVARGLPAVHVRPVEDGRRASAGRPPHLVRLTSVFAVGTLASMGLTTLLIPALLERGIRPDVAACILACLGVAQLPGRAWLARGRVARASTSLRLWPPVLQGLALLLMAALPSAWTTALAVGMFGLGAGVQTLLRPWLVSRLYGAHAAGRWNGEVARVQGLARAAGPVGAAALASRIGHAEVLASLGALTLLSAYWARRLPI